MSFIRRVSGDECPDNACKLRIEGLSIFYGVGNNGGVEVLNGDRDATIDAGKRCDDDLRESNSFSSYSLAYATA